MKLKIFQIVLLVLTLIAGNAHAKRNNKLPKQLGQERVDARQARQAKRIDNGLSAGRLTQKEYDRLKKTQERIAKKEQAFLEDGKLSKKEAKKLEKMQKRASKKIYAQKHDKQRNRMKRQADRIAEGVKNGELTEAEQKQLEASRKAIQEFRKEAKADGKLTAFERKTLRSMKDNASSEIYKLKHNNRAPASLQEDMQVASVDTQNTGTPVQSTPEIGGVQ